MKMTIDVYDMKAKFVALDRDYYTFDGLEALRQDNGVIPSEWQLYCICFLRG